MSLNIFHPDNLSSKNDINRSASRFDDLKLPSLNDLNGGRLFSARLSLCSLVSDCIEVINVCLASKDRFDVFFSLHLLFPKTFARSII